MSLIGQYFVVIFTTQRYDMGYSAMLILLSGMRLIGHYGFVYTTITGVQEYNNLVDKLW